LSFGSITIVEQFIEWLKPIYSNWGYLLVFIFSFLERSFLVGLIVPGNVVVLLGGLYCGLGDLNIVLVIILAFLGSTLGDNLGYLLGAKVARPLVEEHGEFLKLERRVTAAERYFKRYGGFTVFLARFVTFIGSVACPVAGMSRMEYSTFFTYDVSGSFFWAVLFSLLGYFFGKSYELIVKVFNLVGNTLLFVILGIIVVVYVFYKVREVKIMGREIEAIEQDGERQEQ